MMAAAETSNSTTTKTRPAGIVGTIAAPAVRAFTSLAERHPWAFVVAIVAPLVLAIVATTVIVVAGLQQPVVRDAIAQKLNQNLQAVPEAVDRLDRSVGLLHSTMAAQASNVSRHEGALGSLTEQIERLVRQVDGLVTQISTLAERVGALEQQEEGHTDGRQD